MVVICCCLLFFLGYAVLLLLYKKGWNRQLEYTCPADYVPKTKVSVLIPARNEAKNIAACLESVFKNNFPAHLLEVIVIDDFSTDETAMLAQQYLQGRNGKLLSLKQYLSPDERIQAYKKKALSIAIAEASGDWIITTDADCRVPSNWLVNLVACWETNQSKFIVAPVSFLKKKNSLLYFFQSLDFMTMQGITAASLQMNLGNMCNGANLAFNKEAFYAVHGYAGIDHIASGDDMLLMHKIKMKFPEDIHYLKSKEAIVKTEAQPDFIAFINQRIRWSSKADKYNDRKLTWILTLIYGFNLSLSVLLLAVFFDIRFLPWALAFFIGKTGLELFFLVPVSRFYGRTSELVLFPFLQVFHILYILVAGFLGKFGSYRWKGRKVR
jgi:cellulose synthase/poly-beta-1,6-N-acetylglucosamine synthase-like glycosyltransferase